MYKNIFLENNNVKITANEGNIVINRGNNKFIAKIVSGYKEDLRIYGINDNNGQGWSPLAYATYLLTASPLANNPRGCERNDAMSAPILNIIVSSKDVKAKINKLKAMKNQRRSATLIGKRIYIKKFIYKNEDHTSSLRRQGKIEPRNAIIVDDIVVLR